MTAPPHDPAKLRIFEVVHADLDAQTRTHGAFDSRENRGGTNYGAVVDSDTTTSTPMVVPLVLRPVLPRHHPAYREVATPFAYTLRPRGETFEIVERPHADDLREFFRSWLAEETAKHPPQVPQPVTDPAIRQTFVAIVAPHLATLLADPIVQRALVAAGVTDIAIDAAGVTVVGGWLYAGQLVATGARDDADARNALGVHYSVDGRDGAMRLMREAQATEIVAALATL